MPYVNPPPLPAYGADWQDWGGAIHANVAQAVADLQAPVTLSRVCPGTVLRCPWNGTAWTYAGAALSSRPTDRADVYFELTGAPAATADPSWMLDGDSRVDL